MTHARSIAPLIALVGPTGIGKTSLSLEIARRFSAEIVGLDSMQIYRYMDIGTAKPTREERAQAPHHLIDFVDPDEDYTAGRYVSDATAVLADIHGRGHLPLLVGGAGMYLQSLLSGLFGGRAGLELPEMEALRQGLKKRLEDGGRERLYLELQGCDPATAARIHPNDSQRLVRALEIFYATGIPWSEHLARHQEKGGQDKRNILKIGLYCERDELYRRIDQRVELMISAGLIAEVRTLLDMGYDQDLKSMQSIGYRHMINYITSRWTRDEAQRLLARDTRRYAKRQYTWFLRDPDIFWFTHAEMGSLFKKVEDFLR